MSAAGPELATGERVLVTGATGFIGSALVRALADRGVHVVALVEPGAPTASLAGVVHEPLQADILDRAAVARALHGVRVVFHLAALYRFWPSEPRRYYTVNVEGTRTLLDAARAEGCERVVYTSTVATLARRGARPADEASYARPDELAGAYERSKYVAEHEALRAAAAGLPLVIVQPTTPFGPGDAAPTPTGRIVRDFLNGRMPAYVDTSLNVVDVDDVAVGHILAAERGAHGRSYILGGENLDLRAIFALLEACTGLPAPALRLPRACLLPLACVSTALEGRLLRRTPTITIAEARIARRHKAFSDERARRELGYRSRPAAEALVRAARWFAEHGAVSPERLARIRWSVPAPAY